MGNAAEPDTWSISTPRMVESQRPTAPEFPFLKKSIMRTDTIQHFAAGLLIALAVLLIFRAAPVWCVLVSVLVTIGKELVDLAGWWGQPEWRDIWAGVMGALAFVHIQGIYVMKFRKLPSATNIANKARSVIDREVPADELDSLHDWIATNDYKEAPVYILDTYGVKTSKSAAHRWYHSYGVRRRARDAKTIAGEVKEAIKSMGDFSAEQLNELGNIIFSSEAFQTRDAQTFIAMQKVRQTDREQELKERRIEALEAKEKRAAEAKAKLEEAINKTGDGDAITAETLRIMQEAVGMF